MMAYTLDCLLRLLHPVMPFITEEIWQILSKLCPERGFDSIAEQSPCIITAQWPELDSNWQNPEIENQFALYQSTLGALREIRARQKLDNKKKVKFSIKCESDVAGLLEPLGGYFGSMANADLIEMGANVKLDVGAEIKRLEKEEASLTKSIGGKERQLGNEKFVANKPDLADKIRVSLAQAKEQLAAIIEALKKLRDKA